MMFAGQDSSMGVLEVSNDFLCLIFRRFPVGGEQRAAIHGFQEPSTRSNRGFGSRQGTHIYAPVAILMWMLTGEIKKNKSGFAA